jgi:hypothetical protein
MKTTITFPESTLTVTKRDGASVTVDLAKVPESMFAAFLLEGIAEYIRDSSASALINAYATATGEEGTPESRKAWGESNPDLVRAESLALMSDAVTRLYTGERRQRIASESDPLDQYRVAVLRDVMKTEKGAALRAAYDSIPSDDQPARRTFLLSIAGKNAAWVDPLAEKARAAAVAKAKAAKEAAAAIEL